jgi:hypothetical protein
MPAKCAMAMVLAMLAPVTLSGVAAAQNSASPQPMIVSVPDGPPPANAPRTAPPAPTSPAIPGIRIESNGALITGPVNARRTYIPLDRLTIPTPMQGHWAKNQAACVPLAQWDDANGPSAPPDNLRITDTAIIAKARMTATQSYVPLPPSISFAMLQSGKPVQLSARPYRKATEILVIFTLPNGDKNHAVMRLSPSGDSIQLQSHGSNESAIRCAG